MAIELFSPRNSVGVFRGFTQGGLEFHADVVLPYRPEFQRTPMHGQFILVQLETRDEAVLGRISSFSSEGRLSYGSGEEFSIRAVTEERQIPEDLREQYLRYRVNIRVLGVIRVNGGSVTFVASHRRLPHVGSAVAFPSDDILRFIVGHAGDGAALGHYALGEYVYADGVPDLTPPNWMQLLSPEVIVRFAVENMVSRRSFCFARAGFGKSNLTKLLFSTLYERIPTIRKGRREVPVGTVIFDPDGEYFWPDDRGRPGLCDVPHLADKLVVFTNRRNSSRYYQSFVADGIRLDIRRLKPGDVIAIALTPDRQEQQNVRKLRSLSQGRWEELVDLVFQKGNQLALTEISRLLDLDANKQDAEAIAARSNMTAIVRMLHDPASRMMDLLIQALSEGRICVVDVSQMRGTQSMILAGLILRRIFDRNQDQFTEAEPQTIPTIAVVEEAQSVLSDNTGASEPFIAWVKEGRKYDLGAMLITQQPGSISHEILSQGDNWFVFHLLAAGDLVTLKKANAHFSDDILSALLNEPIPGHGVYWSSVQGKSFPISVRVRLFEEMYAMQDESRTRPAAETWALRRGTVSYRPVSDTGAMVTADNPLQQASDQYVEEPDSSGFAPAPDLLRDTEGVAIETFRNDDELQKKLASEEGVPWGELNTYFEGLLPAEWDDLRERAYRFVAKAMTELYGPQESGWEAYRNEKRSPTKSGKYPMYVRVIPK